jgi:uncharacterized protein (TIGR03067 family)
VIVNWAGRESRQRCRTLPAGTWQLVAFEKDGVQAPEADLKQTKYIITGDKYIVERAGKTVEEGWICIDPARKPKVIDVYPTKPEGKVEMGIYEWDGDDKLKVCCTDPGTDQGQRARRARPGPARPRGHPRGPPSILLSPEPAL